MIIMATYKYNPETDTFESVEEQGQQQPSEEQDVSMTPTRLQRAKEALKGKFIELKQRQELKRKQEQEAKMEARELYDKQRLEMLKKREREKVQSKLDRDVMTPQQKIQNFKKGVSKVFDAGFKGTDKLGQLSRRMGKNLGYDDSGRKDLKGFTSNIEKITGNSGNGMQTGDKLNELLGGGMVTTRSTRKNKKMRKTKTGKKKKKTNKTSQQSNPVDNINSFLWR